jgi:CRISPR-associated protein Cas1
MTEVNANTLYITTPDVWIHHELEVIKIEKDKKTIFSVPIHHVEAITILGYSSVSPSLMRKCLERGVSISFLTENGRFLGRVEGATSGNVLLRREQYRKADDNTFCGRISRYIIAGKIQNCRSSILRSAREDEDECRCKALKDTAQKMEKNLKRLEFMTNADEIRGLEGDTAHLYFSMFENCIRQQREDFDFQKRSKHPPRSRSNALLSFFYAILTNDCVSALQATGLDPYVGFLHKDRPGRPSLALDLVEEFRAFGDRLVLTMINRKQVTADSFEQREGGVVLLKPESRRAVLKEYQNRKQDVLTHHYFNRPCRLAEAPLLQARLMAKFIRDELEWYPPFIWR